MGKQFGEMKERLTLKNSSLWGGGSAPMIEVLINIL